MRILAAIVIVSFLVSPATPTAMSPDRIFSENRNSVVRIFTNGVLNGCGFVVSEDGLIVTANHVVTAEESELSEPFSRIEVQQVGGSHPHYATVIDHSRVSDTALLQIQVAKSPHVSLGDLSKTKPFDAATLITFWPGSDVPLLLNGIVSGIGVQKVGKINAQATVFQMPIRKGFSGSPVFDVNGRVIGIVSIRLVGISDDLDSVRRQLNTTARNVQVVAAGVDFGKTVLGLINSLDSDLVSGLGTAIDISYAQEMIKQHEPNK